MKKSADSRFKLRAPKSLHLLESCTNAISQHLGFFFCIEDLKWDEWNLVSLGTSEQSLGRLWTYKEDSLLTEGDCTGLDTAKNPPSNVFMATSESSAAASDFASGTWAFCFIISALKAAKFDLTLGFATFAATLFCRKRILKNNYIEIYRQDKFHENNITV